MLQNKLHPFHVLYRLLSNSYRTDLYETFTVCRYVYVEKIGIWLIKVMMILTEKEAFLKYTRFLAEFNSIFQVILISTLHSM